MKVFTVGITAVINSAEYGIGIHLVRAKTPAEAANRALTITLAFDADTPVRVVMVEEGALQINKTVTPMQRVRTTFFDLSPDADRHFQIFMRNPTDKNRSFLYGYLAALGDVHSIDPSDHDFLNKWLGLDEAGDLT